MKKLALAALATTAFTSSAQAIEGEWYTRVGFGITTADTDSFETYISDVIEAGQGVSEEVSFDHPRGYNLNLGYRHNPYIAFELGYTDFGEDEVSYTYEESYGDLDVLGFEGVETETYKGEVSGTAKTLGAVFSTNTNRTLSGGVRLGYALWSTGTNVMYYWQDIGAQVNAEDNAENYSYSDKARVKNDTDGSDPFYGAFVNWRIGKWTYSLEHTRFNTDETDLSVSSISLAMDL